jgi:hypothetical protein
VIAARRRLWTGGCVGRLVAAGCRRVARGHTSARALVAAGGDLVLVQVLWHTSARTLWAAGDYSVLMKVKWHTTVQVLWAAGDMLVLVKMQGRVRGRYWRPAATRCLRKRG